MISQWRMFWSPYCEFLEIWFTIVPWLHSNMLFAATIVHAIVSLFNGSLRVETHLGPDGTRLKQNVQAKLKSLYKHAGQLVNSRPLGDIRGFAIKGGSFEFRWQHFDNFHIFWWTFICFLKAFGQIYHFGIKNFVHMWSSASKGSDDKSDNVGKTLNYEWLLKSF